MVNCRALSGPWLIIDSVVQDRRHSPGRAAREKNSFPDDRSYVGTYRKGLIMSVKAVAHLKRPSEKQRTLVVGQVPFPPLGTQLNLLFPDGRQTSVILKPGQSLEAKLREVEVRFTNTW